MLAGCRIHAALPAIDLERARRFYAEKLELMPAEEWSDGLVYRCGDMTTFRLFPSGTSTRAGHTQIAFEAPDIDAAVAELKSRGVEFEEYQMPGLTTIGGIADEPSGDRAAWFKDSEGNLVLLVQWAAEAPAGLVP